MRGKTSSIVRAVSALGAIIALAGGVTYAALTSNSVTLSDSTISTGTASLQIYNAGTGAYDDDAPGFTITNLVPGTGVEQPLYLQNNGTTPLAITATVPELPSAPSGSTSSNGGYGFTGFENVKVTITGTCATNNVVSTDLLALNAGQVALPCNPLGAGEQGRSEVPTSAGNYKVKFDINPNAVNGNSAGVGPFDIVLAGTATSTPAPASAL